MHDERSTVRARRDATRPQPMERDEGLDLLRIEHEITEALANAARRDACAELSEYLDRVGDSERMCELVRVASRADAM